MTEDHGRSKNKFSNGSRVPVVNLFGKGHNKLLVVGERERGEKYITAADSGPVDLHDNIMGGLYRRDGAVFVGDFVRSIENEG